MSSRKDKMVETLTRGKAFLEAEKKKKIDMKSNAEVVAKGKLLLEATRKKEYTKVIQLVNQEALPTVDFVDEYNVTPLVYLLAFPPSPSHPEFYQDHFKAVYILISKGANINSANNIYKKTPLSLLASSYFLYDAKISLLKLMIHMSGGKLKLSSEDRNNILNTSLVGLNSDTTHNDFLFLLQNGIADGEGFCSGWLEIINLLNFWKKRSPHGVFQPTFADVVHKNGSIDTSETQEFRLKHKNRILNECQDMANQKAIFYYRLFRSNNKAVPSNLMPIILRFDGFYKNYLDNHDPKDETPEIRKAIDDYIQKVLLKASKSVKMQEAFSASASQQRHLQSLQTSIKFPMQFPMQLQTQLPMQIAFPLQFSNNPFAQSQRSSSSASSSSSSSAGNLWKKDKVTVEEALQGLQPPHKKRRIEKP